MQRNPQDTHSATPRDGADPVRAPIFSPQWGNMGIGLALLALFWFLLKINPTFMGLLAAVTIIANLFAGAVGGLLWGLGLTAAAAFAQFHFGQRPLAIALGLFGIYYFTTSTLQLLRKQ